MSKRIIVSSCLECGARHKSVFCSLNSEQLIELNEHKCCETYKKGEIIFNEGGYARGLYCVKSGKVKMSKTGLSGKEQIIRFASQGDVLGYNSMLSKQPFGSSAMVLEDASVCFVPATQFFQLLEVEPKFSLKLLEITAKNWNVASRLITDMAQKTTKQRLAEMLLWLKETFGLDKDEYIDVKLSREEIANMVGAATEAIIRLLGEFKKRKLVELEGKHIKLLDLEGLALIADLID